MSECCDIRDRRERKREKERERERTRKGRAGGGSAGKMKKRRTGKGHREGRRGKDAGWSDERVGDRWAESFGGRKGPVRQCDVPSGPRSQTKTTNQIK
eukprot:3680423-Rhodomonas_salina.4